MAMIICQALRRGVTRDMRRTMEWRRKAAENGHAGDCLQLASRMYGDEPHARQVGHMVDAGAYTRSLFSST
jgi:TPR repeat protein